MSLRWMLLTLYSGVLAVVVHSQPMNKRMLDGRQCRDACLDYDSGYLLLTHNTSYSASWLTKTDANGNELWSRQYPMGQYGTFFWAMCKCRDGGTVLTGFSFAYNVVLKEYRRCMIVMKVNACAETVWTHLYPATEDGTAGMECMELSSGKLMVFGSSFFRNTGSYTLLTSTGQYISHFTSRQFDCKVKLIGNYIVGGGIGWWIDGDSVETLYTAVTKLDSNLQLIRQKVIDFDVEENTGDVSEMVQVHPDTLYAVVAYRPGLIPTGMSAYVLMEFDSQLNIRKKISFDYGMSPYTRTNNLIQTKAGDFILFCHFQHLSIGQGNTPSIIKFDRKGNYLDSFHYYTQQPDSTGYSVQLLPLAHGDMMAVSSVIKPPFSIQAVRLCRFTENLKIANEDTTTRTYDGRCGKPIKDAVVQVDTKDTIPIRFNFDEVYDPVWRKYFGGIKDIEKLRLFLFPNPVQEQLTVTLPGTAKGKALQVVLYDMLGRRTEISASGNTDHLTIDTRNLSPGPWILSIYYQGKLLGVDRFVKR